MTRNSRTIARNFNAVVEFKWCAVRPNFITLRVYTSQNNSPFPIWSFPLHIAVCIFSAYKMYQITQNENCSNNSLKTGLLAVTIIAVAGGLCFYGYKTFFSVYQIAAISMNPNLIHGDIVITQKVNLSTTSNLIKLAQKTSLSRGDVVIFQHPHKDEIQVKRIIALPGDNIRFDGNVIQINYKVVNQQLIDSSFNNSNFRWLKNSLYREVNDENTYKISITGDLSEKKGVVDIPSEHVFVMGDNRNQSIDRRNWGVLPYSNILESAILIIWSIEPGAFPKIRWNRLATWVD